VARPALPRRLGQPSTTFRSPSTTPVPVPSRAPAALVERFTQCDSVRRVPGPFPVAPSTGRVRVAEQLVMGVDAEPDEVARLVPHWSAPSRSAQTIIAASLWAQLTRSVLAPAGQSHATPSGHAFTTRADRQGVLASRLVTICDDDHSLCSDERFGVGRLPLAGAPRVACRHAAGLHYAGNVPLTLHHIDRLPRINGCDQLRQAVQHALDALEVPDVTPRAVWTPLLKVLGREPDTSNTVSPAASL